MPFCPKCRCEYRVGFTECADCGVSLVDILPDDAEQPGDLDHVSFVPLHSYPSRMHAEMVKEALTNEGIPSVIRGTELFGAMTGLGEAASPKLTVCVPEDRREEAALIADGIIDPL